jgi:hypothetical protein
VRCRHPPDYVDAAVYDPQPSAAHAGIDLMGSHPGEQQRGATDGAVSFPCQARDGRRSRRVVRGVGVGVGIGIGSGIGSGSGVGIGSGIAGREAWCNRSGHATTLYPWAGHLHGPMRLVMPHPPPPDTVAPDTGADCVMRVTMNRTTP